MSELDEERRHQEAVVKLTTFFQRDQARLVAEVERLAGDILTQAVPTFGSREKAADWLMRPAMALEGSRPIELLGTGAGREMVRILLIRLDYCVYT